MNHWIILPILLPAIIAPLLILAVRNDIFLARVFSIACTVALVAFGIFQLVASCDGKIRTYALGNWNPPFGIVLVLDRLAATMLLLTAVIGLVVILYSIHGWDKQGRHFHALFQFQLMGLNGAFLTGDLFNLFVFYEVLLIASYGLMVHGGGNARVRAGIQYVVVNLVGSCLFLIAITLIYSVTGTLNMADLFRKIGSTPAASQAILNVGGVLLLVVFALKSAIFPLHLWLLGTYSNAPGPVAALFSIMTKVGVYSMLRVQPLLFPSLELIVPAALITLFLGSVGILVARSFGQQASFAALASIGTLLVAVGGSSTENWSAAMYYLVHSTLSVASFFLIVDLLVANRPNGGDALIEGPNYANRSIVGALYFVIAIALSGMPPLSGFIGKLLILQGAQQQPNWGWVWSVILVSSLIGIIGLSKSGSLLFWKCGPKQADVESLACTEVVSIAGSIEPTSTTSIAIPLVSIGAVLLLIISLSVFAGPICMFMDATADQLRDRDQYNIAVLDQRV